MDATLRIVKHIKDKPGQGILLLGNKKNILTAYCDADLAACTLSGKYISEFTISLGLIDFMEIKKAVNCIQKLN